MPDDSPPSDHIPGLTRRQVAEKTGLSESTVARMEHRFCIRLAIALHKDPATRHMVPSSYKKFLSSPKNSEP